MLLVDSFRTSRVIDLLGVFGIAAVVGTAGLSLVGSSAWAQSGTPTSQVGATKLSPLGSDISRPGPQWQELTPVQQKVLLPLASTWNSLGGERKNKWIALAQTYQSLGPAEQEKLQGRMAEWAALSPKDRELARLNFAETKKRAHTDRNANWETYQALSPEEKQRLAAQTNKKPTGAAVAVKPIDPTKLTPVPLTRRSPEQGDPAKAAKPQLDRNTLLPRPPSHKANP